MSEISDQVSEDTANNQYRRLLVGIPSDPEAEKETDAFVQAMSSLAEESVTPLPRDFSREDIYAIVR